MGKYRIEWKFHPGQAIGGSFMVLGTIYPIVHYRRFSGSTHDTDPGPLNRFEMRHPSRSSPI